MLQYTIETSHKEIGKYFRHLITSHGFNYNWQIKTLKNFSQNTINIRVSELDNKVAEEKPLIEYLFTTDSAKLAAMDLVTDSHGDEHSQKWGYIYDNNEYGYSIPSAIPIPACCTKPIIILGNEWNVNSYVFVASKSSYFAVSKNTNRIQHVIFSINIVGLLERAIYGSKLIDSSNFDSWADIYGVDYFQGIAKTCYVDKIINFILYKMHIFSPQAFPVKIDYFPPNKSAPLIITGDSDSASITQIEEYLNMVTEVGGNATILLKSGELLTEDFMVKEMQNGHCFGIHPFSELNTAKGFCEKFDELVHNHVVKVGLPLPAVRNHYFQYIRGVDTHRLECEIPVLFDLNCVAASGKTFIGSASGIGFPLAFPPKVDHVVFEQHPLHFPTLIEDDVFLFDYDYCYKSFDFGDRLSIQVCTDFLEEWLIKNRLPALVNLHPEHVTVETKIILEAILKFKSENNIWAPNLLDFAKWIDERSKTKLNVVGFSNDTVSVEIELTTSVLLDIPSLEGFSNETKLIGPGKHSFQIAIPESKS